MKTDIQNQIAIYTDRLNTLKVNRYNERHTLTDEGTRSFDEQIIMTAEFIQVLKKQKNEIQAYYNKQSGSKIRQFEKDEGWRTRWRDKSSDEKTKWLGDFRNESSAYNNLTTQYVLSDEEAQNAITEYYPTKEE